MYLLIYTCTCGQPFQYNGASLHNTLDEAKEAAQLHNDEMWQEGEETEITWTQQANYGPAGKTFLGKVDPNFFYGTSGENYFIIDSTPKMPPIT